MRVRRKGDTYTQTIKKGAGIRRFELEIALTREQFDVLWQATADMRIEKTRYELDYQSHRVELDVYTCLGLKLQSLIVPILFIGTRNDTVKMTLNEYIMDHWKIW